MLRCVVCGALIAPDAEQYANTWERSRKKYPCCAGCVARFDPDVHWMPARLPERAPSGEQARLTHMFVKRLAARDNPRVLVREMLLAGLDPVQLRRKIEMAARDAAAAQDRADRRTLFNTMLLLARIIRVPNDRDERESRDFEDALDDLDAWEAATR